MSNKPILFYSSKENECVEIWKNKLDDFYKVSVDSNTKIPDFVRNVPCIFIKGRPIIEGPSVKLFIDSYGSLSTGRIQSTTNVPDFKKKPDTDINNNFDKAPDIQTSTNNLNGIADFNAIEMDSSYSDKYSFITDNPPPMDNCYQFLNSMKDNNITGAVSSSEKKQQTEFEKRLEDLQRERNL